jgi:hypothetical protein
MLLNNKFVNENYIYPEQYIPFSANLKNKQYIDNWLLRNYKALFIKFSRNDDKITKKGYCKRDVLHETIIRIYINKVKYKNQEDCDNQLNNFFHIKTK